MPNKIKAYFSVLNVPVKTQYQEKPLFPDEYDIYENFTLFRLKFGREFRLGKWGFEPQSGIFYWRNQYSRPTFRISGSGSNAVLSYLGTKAIVPQEAGLLLAQEIHYNFSQVISVGLSAKALYILDLGFDAYTLGIKIGFKI